MSVSHTHPPTPISKLQAISIEGSTPWGAWTFMVQAEMKEKWRERERPEGNSKILIESAAAVEWIKISTEFSSRGCCQSYPHLGFSRHCQW
jgi:hypothetical protein